MIDERREMRRLGLISTGSSKAVKASKAVKLDLRRVKKTFYIRKGEIFEDES